MPTDMPLGEILTRDQAIRYLEDYLIPETATFPCEDALRKLDDAISMYIKKGLITSPEEKGYKEKQEQIRTAWDRWIDFTE
jgi:hypothetical protein